MDPDPDPSVTGTDPGIRNRIRTKMSRIPNTDPVSGLVRFPTIEFQPKALAVSHMAKPSWCLLVSTKYFAPAWKTTLLSVS